jgi:hypothetical protein
MGACTKLNDSHLATKDQRTFSVSRPPAKGSAFPQHSPKKTPPSPDCRALGSQSPQVEQGSSLAEILNLGADTARLRVGNGASVPFDSRQRRLWTGQLALAGQRIPRSRRSATIRDASSTPPANTMFRA